MKESFMQNVHEDLKPGTYVEVLTKQQQDGTNCRGTIIQADPNTRDTYVVEYDPGEDNGHHAGNELKIIARSEGDAKR
jgi:hypothetical protein